jgi:hypothetical protein
MLTITFEKFSVNISSSCRNNYHTLYFNGGANIPSIIGFDGTNRKITV